MSDDFVTRRELNGLGERVNTLSEKQAATAVQVEVNKDDVGKLWEAIDCIRQTIQSMKWQIALIVGVGIGINVFLQLLFK